LAKVLGSSFVPRAKLSRRLKAHPLGLILAGVLLLGARATRLAAAEVWQPLGPEGGIVSLLAYAPSDPRVVYAGTAAGSVFRSDDNGARWTLASQGLPFLPVLALAVDPSSADVVYVGNSHGVWKSASGGRAWEGFPNLLSGVVVTALAIDPVHVSTIYAGAAGPSYSDATQQGGVFRSDDGGRTWAPRPPGLTRQAGVAGLAVDPVAPDSLVAATLDLTTGSGRLWKSDDGGASWRPILVPVDIYDPTGFAFDRAGRNIYLTTYLFLLKSSDFGDSWSSVDLGGGFAPSSLSATASGQLYGVFGYQGDNFISRSADGGNTWIQVSQTPADVQLVAVDPDLPDRVLAGSVRGGLFRSSNGGMGWSVASAGLLASTITALAVDAESPSTVYAGTDVDGALKTADAGAHWRNLKMPIYYPAGVSGLVVNAGTTRELLVVAAGDLERSGDAGATWLASDPDVSGCSAVSSIAADPTTRTVYATLELVTLHGCTLDCFGASVSRDGGANWQCALGVADSFANSVVIDPVDPRVVYINAYHELWKSVDRGRDFVKLPYLRDGNVVLSLAVSPVDHEIVWAGTATEGVLKSAVGGQLWTRSSTDLPAGAVLALVADPQDAATVYAVVSGSGVFASHDGGARWRQLGDGLPVAAVDAVLAIDAVAHQRILYVGTAGAGLFALPLP
jgi:photosystem II stability/assembly factor-like uncharacterized protein